MNDQFISIGPRRVAARVQVPQQPRGTVVFVHGSGVDRYDPRNQFVADKLQRAQFGTVMLDLLEPQEALDYRNAFDVELQAARLLAALDDLQRSSPLPAPLGYFATGVGAGVALLAAAKRPESVAAVVSRSGRPDTALFSLPRVQAATLLIVDEPDQWNELALERLAADKELAVVPSAAHRYGEPAALEAVARHALRWFSRHLGYARLRALHPELERCEVTVEDRPAHRYERRRFNVRLDLDHSGRHVVVNREHDEDPSVALGQAFDAAHSNLQAVEAARRFG